MTSRDDRQLAELKETIREQRFKLRAVGLLLTVARGKLPKKLRGQIDAGLFSLTTHTRGEKPLVFKFMGQEIVEP